jgi:hypothetical protein
LWRFVEELGMDLPMVAMVSPHPHRLPEDHNPVSPCKYFIQSPAFRQQFGSVAEAQVFGMLIGYCRNAKGGLLGRDEVVVCDDNGDNHIFQFETFFNTHEALTLAYHVRKHHVPIVIPRIIATR